MMFHEIGSKEEFDILVEKEQAVLAYFSTDACNVCKVLKPKIAELIASDFPHIKPVYIKSDLNPEVAAQNRIFVAPTIIVYFEGRETIRKSRNISVDELKREILRPYSVIFE